MSLEAGGLVSSLRENGLGFRALSDVADSFACKLWWKLANDVGIWAKYINAISWMKSCARGRLARVAEFFHQNVGKIIQNGSSNIWEGNWLNDGVLLPSVPSHTLPRLTFNQIFVDGAWCTHLIQDYLPPSELRRISKFSLCFSEGNDRLVWKPNSSGIFSVSSAYESIITSGPRVSFLRHLWVQQLPWKLSFFGWRLLNALLPFHPILHRWGFSFPSKCPFCAFSDTFNHFFLTCRIAVQAWVFIEEWLQLRLPSCNNLRDFLQYCWNPASSLLLYTIPLVVMWALWRCRCSLLYGDGSFGVRRISSFIVGLFQELSSRHPIPASEQQCRLYRRLGLHSCVIRSHFKLNSDGSLMNGRSAAAFVLRNCMGQVVVAQTVYLGQKSILYAEAYALLLGYRFCRAHHFTNVEFCSDSKLLVQFLIEGARWPWEIFYILAELRTLSLQVQGSLSHVYRETNHVADALAKEAVLTPLSMSYHFSSLPRFVKGLLHLDRLSIPSVRKGPLVRAL
ncbi:hypothetical protein K2173_005321 [Erythroxylum novogranatense]|uniref:RNase H type-1 domain-containing protein n=1 Tax=Erythroxylum novogranatense TaxID=1862640 RepID=A0AAV8TKZ5_9ROSI|nr:hypothetical protein K2173_005321 [Erythroxylum novogranatense]